MYRNTIQTHSAACANCRRLPSAASATCGVVPTGRGPYRPLPTVRNSTRMPTAGATCHQPSKLPGVAIRCTRATARARSALRVPPVASHPGHRRALRVPPVASHPGHRRQAEKPSPSHTATTGLCARDQPSSDTTSAPRLHRCARWPQLHLARSPLERGRCVEGASLKQL